MPLNTPKQRPNLFDNLRNDPNQNLFCSKSDLDNEASVEAFFVNRLLKDMGFRDNQIKTKQSISKLQVPRGRSTVLYKPDYVITYRQKPRLVIDAKSTTESLNKWTQQCSGYCLLLNQKFEDHNPVELFILTNGLATTVYKWDIEEPLLELDFADFNIGNPKYEQFRAVLDSLKSASKKASSAVESHTFTFRRPSPSEAKRVFGQCHKIIWKSEGFSPTAAFMEFVKLVFVKMWADRELREDASIRALLMSAEEDAVKLPKASVTFSMHWIEGSKADNPINDVLFKQLRDRIERDIALRKKKRIFEADELIDMRPDTIKAVVRKLEHLDLFGIDEDLNGRLFETFLSATMRGRELGQYFTPRSIVKLMVAMSGLKASATEMTTTIDACCGTGGFLIEILADMREKIRNNRSISVAQRERLFAKLANDSIYGIDFGKSPPIAKIARINMYLHGDGGSRIYYADALDMELQPAEDQEPEILQNQDELRTALADGLQYDVALTNPPFSMTKEMENDSDARILRQYELAQVPNTSQFRPTLRSSAMFLERYWTLLKPGGYLFTVIDDTLLSSTKFTYAREFIRSKFVIRAIISLPGDAFIRSDARVKTSVLCLQRKQDFGDSQPDVFYYFAEHVGVDDLPSKASEHDIASARLRATEEIAKISTGFRSFLDGEPVATTVSPDRIQDRLDLKHVVPLKGRMVQTWQRDGISVRNLEDVVQLAFVEVKPKDSPEHEYTLISLSYDGECRESKKLLGKHFRPETMYQVSAGDLVYSNIRAIDGAIAIVPDEFGGALVSGSYTVLRCKTYVDTVYLWAILRSHEIRADLMSDSTGTGRYITYWEDARKVQIPWQTRPNREKITRGYIKAWSLQLQIVQHLAASNEGIAELGIESENSKTRFRTYQPPK